MAPHPHVKPVDRIAGSTALAALLREQLPALVPDDVPFMRLREPSAGLRLAGEPSLVQRLRARSVLWVDLKRTEEDVRAGDELPLERLSTILAGIGLYQYRELPHAPTMRPELVVAEGASALAWVSANLGSQVEVIPRVDDADQLADLHVFALRDLPPPLAARARSVSTSRSRLGPIEGGTGFVTYEVDTLGQFGVLR